MAKANGRDQRQAWIKWYTRDWRADAPLRMCSYAARGLWADLLTLMAESRHFGFLLVEGVIPTAKQLSGLLGGNEREITKLKTELGEANVFSVTGADMPEDVAALVPAEMPAGVMLSRRMVRDKAKSDKDRENGKGGGNPNLSPDDNPGVNPQANPQSQKSEIRSSEAKASAQNAKPPDLLFKVWLPWLMERTGRPRAPCASQIGKWRKSFDNNDLSLLSALDRCKAEGTPDPMGWMEGAARSHKNREPGEKTARQMLDEIEASGVYDGVIL